MTNVCSNPVRHILRDVPQEETSHDGEPSKRDTGVPDVLDTLRIRPSCPDRRGMNDGRSQTWDLRSCKLFGGLQEQRHELLGRCERQTGLDRIQANVRGKLRRDLVDEDIVVDGVADGATDDADGEREGNAGGDEFVGAHRDGDSGSWNEHTPDAETGDDFHCDSRPGIIGRDSGESTTKCG